MDHSGYKTKTPAFPLATLCLILPHFIQVSRGELAGPISNSVQVKYLISSDDVHVLSIVSHLLEFYQIQIEVIIKQQYFT